MFASVYETDEYRQIAYPAVMLKNVSDDRFTWENGVKGAALQITGDQKEALLDAYRKDVSELRMEQLEEELPCGYTRIKSSADGGTTDMFVYPFLNIRVNYSENTVSTRRRHWETMRWTLYR